MTGHGFRGASEDETSWRLLPVPPAAILLGALAMILAMVPAARGQEASVVQLHGHDTDAFDEFGSAAAIDGSLVLVGAMGMGPIPEGGAAYVFRYTGEGPFDGWAEEVRFREPLTTRFGEAVALAGTLGETGIFSLVGAPDTQQPPYTNQDLEKGEAHVYRYDGVAEE